MVAMKSHPSLQATFYLVELILFLTWQGIYQLTNILSTPMQGQCNLLSLDVFKDDVIGLKQVPRLIFYFTFSILYMTSHFLFSWTIGKNHNVFNSC